MVLNGLLWRQGQLWLPVGMRTLIIQGLWSTNWHEPSVGYHLAIRSGPIQQTIVPSARMLQAKQPTGQKPRFTHQQIGCQKCYWANTLWHDPSHKRSCSLVVRHQPLPPGKLHKLLVLSHSPRADTRSKGSFNPAACEMEAMNTHKMRWQRNVFRRGDKIKPQKNS